MAQLETTVRRNSDGVEFTAMREVDAWANPECGVVGMACPDPGLEPGDVTLYSTSSQEVVFACDRCFDTDFTNL